MLLLSSVVNVCMALQQFGWDPGHNINEWVASFLLLAFTFVASYRSIVNVDYPFACVSVWSISGSKFLIFLITIETKNHFLSVLRRQTAAGTLYDHSNVRVFYFHSFVCFLTFTAIIMALCRRWCSWRERP